MSAAPLITVRDLVKTYRNGDEETQVLRGLSFDLGRGELVGLLGPSGSGKSTLLSIMGLLLRPTSGTVCVKGEAMFTMNDRRLSAFRNQNLGFVFQFHHLLPDFTALENVAFPAAAPAGGISKEMRARATMLLERVGLANRIDFLATQLSGGQKQRVAIARALMNAPDFILADEPTGNLDRESSDQVMSLIKEIQREQQTTFLISTHDPDIADVCDRRIRLLDGRIVAGS
jgi:lipoprotein-releasing system ATP-binding protein